MFLYDDDSETLLGMFITNGSNNSSFITNENDLQCGLSLKDFNSINTFLRLCVKKIILDNQKLDYLGLYKKIIDMGIQYDKYGDEDEFNNPIEIEFYLYDEFCCSDNKSNFSIKILNNSYIDVYFSLIEIMLKIKNKKFPKSFIQYPRFNDNNSDNNNVFLVLTNLRPSYLYDNNDDDNNGYNIDSNNAFRDWIDTLKKNGRISHLTPYFTIYHCPIASINPNFY